MKFLLSAFKKLFTNLSLDELVILVAIALFCLGLFVYIVVLVVQLSRALDPRAGQKRLPERSLRKALISTARIDDEEKPTVTRMAEEKAA